MKDLTIIGTSHISKQSIQEIKKAILEEKPDIVAVELDIQRAAALFHDEKRSMSPMQIFRIGVKGFLFVKIGQYVQKKLGNMVGVSPGSEMKMAIKMAKKEKLEIALIDQPIQITLRKFSRALGWKEKWTFFMDFVKGIVSPKKQLRELGLEKFDLTKVPEKKVIEKMMKQMKSRYPSIYKTLVEDRNRYMVKKLVQIAREKPGKKVLAVVGAGHKDGMEELLLKVDVVR